MKLIPSLSYPFNVQGENPTPVISFKKKLAQTFTERLCMTDFYPSLEFIAETRILAEMKIENHETKYFPWQKKNRQEYIFFLWKLRWWICECKLKVEDWIIMNFSVLDFFKFASRMPQIAQILILTIKNSPGAASPWTSLDISSFFFL